MQYLFVVSTGYDGQGKCHVVHEKELIRCAYE